jgi:NitT/TauT family transport system substrate-binding protein
MDAPRRSRRELLRLSGLGAGALCLGGLLAACGAPAAAPSPTSAPAPAPTQPPAKPAATQPAAAPPAAPTQAPAAAKPANVPKLLVSYGSPVGSFAALWMAKAIGAFEKYGVEVDVQLVETATAIPGLISNSIEAAEVSAAPVLTADVNGNQDLVLIASALNHPILALYAGPDISTADTLKGKIIASDKPGTPVDYSARLSLSLLGLKPEDVDLRAIGNSSEIVAAMLSGQVQAGMVAPPQSFQVEGKGFHLLQDIFSQPYQNVGLVAKKSRLDELAPGLRPLLAAYRDGIQAWNTQPDLAMRVQDEYAKVGDPESWRKTYEFYTKTAPFEPSMQPTMEGIKAMMDFLTASVPAMKDHKPEDFVDTRLLSNLPSA